MLQNNLLGILIPFAGTTLGAAAVFFLKETLSRNIQRALTGFAAGVMVAASVWSLLIPTLEQSAESGLGHFAFLPAAIGFWIGTLFLLLLDKLIPHLHLYAEKAEGRKSRISKTAMLLLAVTIHNIPEGMAVGIVYAGFLSGIAIQNFPEGAIISPPLLSSGSSKPRAFFYGLLSGAVEPLAALVMLAATDFFIPAMPYLLSFAAGAMLYVVVEELIPEMSEGEHSDIGVLSFALGFTLMMALDVALG